VWPLEAVTHTPHGPNGIFEKNNSELPVILEFSNLQRNGILNF
jgi:hypothetical protein